MRHHTKRLTLLIWSLCCGGWVVAAQAATLHAVTPQAATAHVGKNLAPAASKNRIVIQVNEDGARKWNDVLVNIHNIQLEIGEKNIAIAVVAIGPALGMLKADSLAANGVQEALATGVEFVACGNSMRAQKLIKDDLVEGVKTSIAGYVELMHRQQQGWAYLRP